MEERLVQLVVSVELSQEIEAWLRERGMRLYPIPWGGPDGRPTLEGEPADDFRTYAVATVR